MISIIACVGKNMELGKNNSLVWHIPKDLQFFKETTMGHKIIMGSNTYKSLPGKLPGRELIVVSYEKLNEDVQNVLSIEPLLKQYENSDEEVFICGGASIYKQFMPYAKKMYITEVDAVDSEADVFFPRIDRRKWQRSIIDKDIYGDIKYKICIYKRR